MSGQNISAAFLTKFVLVWRFFKMSWYMHTTQLGVHSMYVHGMRVHGVGVHGVGVHDVGQHNMGVHVIAKWKNAYRTSLIAYL
jgi:hypothetical protein